jgi:hypothetical protein
MLMRARNQVPSPTIDCERDCGGVQHVHAERTHFKGTDQGIRIQVEPGPRSRCERYQLQGHRHGGCEDAI